MPDAVLDAGAFPHLLDAVIAHAPAPSLLALRAASRHCKARADARLAAHLVVEDRGMGGRWFAAWHAALNPSMRARPDPSSLFAASFNAYAVYTHAGRMRVLGAPPTDTYYNWMQFARPHGPFVPGARAYFPLVRVLDLHGDVGAVSDTQPFTHEVELTRLMPGLSGEMDELPPPTRTLALFPAPGEMAPHHILDVKTVCRRVVVNVAWHEAPGLVRLRLRDLEGVREVVISFAGWRAMPDARAEGRGEQEGHATLLHGPEEFTPAYFQPSDEPEDEDEETLPWKRLGPRESDNLRWQELAFLVALSLSCGARVTVVDLDRVDPAWLDPDFAPGSLRPTDPTPLTPTPQASAPPTPQAPAQAAGPDLAAAHASTLRDLKATLRGLRSARRQSPSFWLVNGLRVYGLCTVVMPPSTRGVRFLSSAQYVAEADPLEIDAGAFAL
ncbi:hypothetical protein CC85DRAFT_286599 [Cutaneotrichosporon oleaginosum]|uniref:Uncharacterized protein n=1 Tax=Cutaneotrichosporon oleaginosum TaxID=879819 RepID=A0A0J1B100_9TREE|nr:uncharacterized protein CC85DRAFT_286599 [Cutaneotrichosporon oleaginosum]KLT41279.1 hypothetical protein CC85DRAFT_286599 [Cutaneotrichosporon oleaginosum]TXT14029.1 hypothetical protein COLE_00222 [Cutaneotrichosporon oleaginosum]